MLPTTSTGGLTPLHLAERTKTVEITNVTPAHSVGTVEQKRQLFESLSNVGESDGKRLQR